MIITAESWASNFAGQSRGCASRHGQHENAVLRREARRLQYEPADRAWFAALTQFIPRSRWAQVFPVTPATLLAWHRRLAARKYDTSKRRLAWLAADDPEHRPVDSPAGAREPVLRLPAYSRRADQAGRDHRAVHCLRAPASRRYRSRAAPELARRVRGDAAQVHPAGAVLDEHQHV